MIARIQPSKLGGSVYAPPSKSCTQRACAAAWIRGGSCTLLRAGESEDEKAALGILQSWGAHIKREDDLTRISFPEGRKTGDLHCGESGLSLRMFLPLAALHHDWVDIHGSGSLLQRRLQPFLDILPQLGVAVESNQGSLPLRVRGPLLPRDIELDASLSSQFLTGLLLAYAAGEGAGKTIRVRNLVSRPYIDLTLALMRQFQLPVPVNRNYEEFIFPEVLPPIPSDTIQYTVEADWSGASFMLVAGALAGPVQVRGLDLQSVQADRALIDFMMEAGAGLAVDAKGITVHPVAMEGFSVDATDCPDLFPPLVALAAACRGKSRIRGIHRLVHKESNRAQALKSEFEKTGVAIELSGKEMIVEGRSQINGNHVSSHGDHRIAMALAVHALRGRNEMTIENAEAVNKSYPGFFRDLRALGASIRQS